MEEGNKSVGGGVWGGEGRKGAWGSSGLTMMKCTRDGKLEECLTP